MRRSALCSFLALGLSLLNGLVQASLPPGVGSIPPSVRSNEVPYCRDIFSVGGQYQFDATLNGSLLVNQIYVEKLVPVNGSREPYPLVFFHGATPTGTLNTPDNRRGFASLFIDQGYEVYLLDQSSVGRASSMDFTGFPEGTQVTAEMAESGFTAPRYFGFYPQAVLHTQWPGTGLKGDPTFDKFLGTILPLSLNLTRQQRSMQNSGCALLEKIGKSFLMAHSTGGTYATLIADACPDKVVGYVGLEPDNSPFRSYSVNVTRPVRIWGLADIPLTYDPPVTDPTSQLAKAVVGDETWANRSCILQASNSTRSLPNIAQSPILVLTGEASIHITYDHCIVAFLRQAGVSVDWIELSQIGIHGNGHLGFMELNNQIIFQVALTWIRDHTPMGQ
ncbi:MAG: hypothetical protein M1838_004001 [Thelocarpon superellum]|nr:MAG: hypothetical protein M1838_004001 [Thelocarpon superellum]